MNCLQAHSNLEYERRRSEYEENWSMHVSERRMRYKGLDE